MTVGAQMPFDRLVLAVDEWARSRGRQDLFAQTAETKQPPRHMPHAPFLAPQEFLSHVRAADLLVAHAGMGSILTALEHGKPILVMPRRGDLAETRNDHQISTARMFAERGWVLPAFDTEELIARLDHADEITRPTQIASHAPKEFLDALRAFVDASSS